MIKINFKQALLATVISSVMFLVACSEDDETVAAPVASFTVSDETSGSVTFTNTSSNATSYSWNFGDGTSSTQESPTKTYAANGAYTVTLTARGEGGENSTSQEVTISMLADPDTQAPVITLLGEVSIEVAIGGTYEDAGATATDDVDGDITANIEVTGEVNTLNPGVYTLAYNVSDAAGNDATEVTRTVTVTYDDGLLTNGDFEGETGEPWFTNYGDNTPEIREEGGNQFFFLNNDAADPTQTFILALSQVLEIGNGNTYRLSFNASTGAGATRTIEAGIGLNEGDFRANVEVITLTENTQRFELDLVANGFGSANSRVLFNMFGDIGVVVLDNISLELIDEYSVGLPLDFESEDVIVSPFNGVAFAFVADPDDANNQVGQITNIGAEFEGVTFSLGTPIDLSNDKTISIQFNTSTADVPVLLKLEGSAPIESFVTATSTGWQELSFDFSASSGTFNGITIFVDGPGFTAGTFYIDDIVQKP